MGYNALHMCHNFKVTKVYEFVIWYIEYIEIFFKYIVNMIAVISVTVVILIVQ